MTQIEIAKKLAKALDMKKARDVVVLNLNGETIIADLFVICTAGSSPQMRALYDSAVEEMVKSGINPTSCEGIKNPDWALIDFEGVVLHIFSPEMREFYGLENLWADAERIDVEFENEQ